MTRAVPAATVRSFLSTDERTGKSRGDEANRYHAANIRRDSIKERWRKSRSLLFPLLHFPVILKPRANWIGIGTSLSVAALSVSATLSCAARQTPEFPAATRREIMRTETAVYSTYFSALGTYDPITFSPRHDIIIGIVLTIQLLFRSDIYCTEKSEINKENNI